LRSDIAIYAVDVGSIKRKRFAWARHGGKSGTDIKALADCIVKDLKEGKRVALGVECPLFVPCPEDPHALGMARLGEGNRSFTASPGACAAVTGMTQLAWILRYVKEHCRNVRGTTCWCEFVESENSRLYVWEAFVSGKSKGKDHSDDAKAAVKAFKRVMKNDSKGPDSAVTAEGSFSIAEALLLWAGLSGGRKALNRPCVVVKGLTIDEF
jgi:hypothetical protein